MKTILAEPPNVGRPGLSGRLGLLPADRVHHARSDVLILHPSLDLTNTMISGHRGSIRKHSPGWGNFQESLVTTSTARSLVRVLEGSPMRVSVTVALSAELASMLDAELAPPEKQRPASAGLAGKHGPRAVSRGLDASATNAPRSASSSGTSTDAAGCAALGSAASKKVLGLIRLPSVPFLGAFSVARPAGPY
jgi:hypothetical protein